jgi:hypothetical protein
MHLEIGVISPQDWGLPACLEPPDVTIDAVGTSLAVLERNARAATYEWLLGQLDSETGAFHGFYRAPDRHLDFPQTVNLIAPWQLFSAYDRYRDDNLLQVAARAATWFYDKHVITHPMSFVAGGVRDGIATDEVWTKFTAEEIITCHGLWKRTGEKLWLERAMQSGRYLIQARRHNFAPRYHLASGNWIEKGWNSWGRVVEANLLLWQACGDDLWRAEALQWGEYALGIQFSDGGYYLIDGEYFNTDLAPDELRALVLLYEVTSREVFLAAARRFADWILSKQTAHGAWPLTIDVDGNVVMPVIGPGDVPNIGIALLRLFHITREQRYLEAVQRTLRYTLRIQAVPDSTHPYIDDEKVSWGFWSWDPYYDFTLSADQSTHHTRAMWFIIDYLNNYPL